MKIENNFKNPATVRGFSLIEVLFSLLVFSFGAISILGLMVSTTKNEVLSKDQIIAAQLVQEGMELTRNLADNKYALASGTYRVDYLVDNINANGRFSSSADKRLYLKNGYFSHDSTGTSTKFYRKIETDVSVANQITITSTVFWGDTTGTFPATCNIATKCETAKVVVFNTSYTP